MVVWSALRAALLLFFFLLMFRLVMEWVFVFARDYRPKGAMAVALEATYSVTDPPYKALRRVIPPLRIGSIAIDLAFLILLIVVTILLSVIP